MSARALRLWIVLAACAAVAWCTLDPSPWLQALAGAACLGGAVLIIALDGLLRRR